MKYIVVKLDDGGDIRKIEFDSVEEAEEELKDELKAYLITVDGTYKIEDHT